jgi:Lrp/AsnC family transcriptional regulator
MLAGIKAIRHMDQIDLKILTQLQSNGSLSVPELGRLSGISATACWRRLQKLGEERVILGRVTLIEPSAVSLGLTAFVSLKLSSHTAETARQLAAAAAVMPEVVTFYRLSGDVDYVLQVVVPDVVYFDAFCRKLKAKVDTANVNSRFVLQELKHTTELPLAYALLARQRARKS